MGRTGIYCGLANHCASAYRPLEAGLAKKLPSLAVCAAGSALWDSDNPSGFRLLESESKVHTANLEGLFVPCDANDALWSDTNPDASYVVLPAGSLVWGDVNVETVPLPAAAATPRQAFIGYSDEFNAPLFAVEVNGNPCVYIGTQYHIQHESAFFGEDADAAACKQKTSQDPCSVDLHKVEKNLTSLRPGLVYVRALPQTRAEAASLLLEHLVPGQLYTGFRHKPETITGLLRGVANSVGQALFERNGEKVHREFLETNAGVLVCLDNNTCVFIEDDSAVITPKDRNDHFTSSIKYQNHWGRFVRWENNRWVPAAQPGDAVTWLQAPLLHYRDGRNKTNTFEHASLHNGIENSANYVGFIHNFGCNTPYETAKAFVDPKFARLHTPTGRLALKRHLPLWYSDLVQNIVSSDKTLFFSTAGTSNGRNPLLNMVENSGQWSAFTDVVRKTRAKPHSVQIYRDASETHGWVYTDTGNGTGPRLQNDEAGYYTVRDKKDRTRILIESTPDKQLTQEVVTFNPTGLSADAPDTTQQPPPPPTLNDLYNGTCSHSAGLAGIAYARKMAWSKTSSREWITDDFIRPNFALADAIFPASMTPARVANYVYGAARVHAVQEFLSKSEQTDIDFMSDEAIDALLTACVSVAQDYTDANRELQTSGRALLRALNKHVNAAAPEALYAMARYAYSKHAVLAIAAANGHEFTRDPVVDLAVAKAAETHPVYTTFIPLIKSGVPVAAFLVLPRKMDLNRESIAVPPPQFNLSEGRQCTRYSENDWETGRGRLSHEVRKKYAIGVYCGNIQYAVDLFNPPDVRVFKETKEIALSDDDRISVLSLIQLAKCDQRLQQNCGSDTETTTLTNGEWNFNRSTGVLTHSDNEYIVETTSANSGLALTVTQKNPQAQSNFKLRVAMPKHMGSKGLADVHVMAAIAQKYPNHTVRVTRSSAGLPFNAMAFTKKGNVYCRMGKRAKIYTAHSASQLLRKSLPWFEEAGDNSDEYYVF